ncbi:uncharacterized protein LOC143037054 isoform X3 [Oratosquilla oratoria]|uniref:uncharacterized protein LOC143037054 isoform X3 n=1 Tax=Oratosquilla oratoria TaxID=337810 RepID=UPI003F765587
MEDDDREKRLQAGKEKFHQYLKKKCPDGEDQQDSKKRKKEGTLESQNLLEEGMKTSKESEDDLSDSRTSGSTASDISFLQCHVAQLQEEVQAKKMALEALLYENEGLKQKTSTASPDSNITSTPYDKNIIEQYKNKISEFQSAVAQRDQMLEQLQVSLSVSLQQRDQQELEMEKFTREIETLKMQLKEATDFLENKKLVSGTSLGEFLELKHKLIYLQQERLQDQQTIQQVSEQLATKTEAFGNLDHKYKMLLRNYKQMAEKHKVELQNSKQKEEEMQKEFKKEIKDAKDKINSGMQERQLEKEQASAEIQSLMKELQQLTTQLEETKVKHKEQEELLGEQFGKQIATIKEQMSQQHSENLEELKKIHEIEIAGLSKQIDEIEKVQKEDQMRLLEKVQYLEANNKSLSEQVEVEKQKSETQQNQVSYLSLELNKAREEIENLQKLRESLIQVEKYRNTLEGKIKELQEERCKREENIKEVNMKCEFLQTQVFECERKIDNSHQELERVVVEAQKSKEIIQKLNNEKECRENEYAEHRKQFERSISLLEEENGSVKQLLCERNDEIVKLKQEKEDKNSQIKELNERSQQISLELGKEREEKLKMENFLKNVQNEKESLIVEKEHLQVECLRVRTLENTFEELETEVKLKVQLENELHKLRPQIEQLQGTCTLLESENSKLKVEYQEYQEQCQGLSLKVEELTGKLEGTDNALKEYEELRTRHQDLENSYVSLKEEKENQTMECNKQNSELSEKVSLLSGKLVETENLFSEHQNLCIAKSSLENKVKDLTQKMQEVCCQNENLTGELNQALEKIEQLKCTSDSYRITLEQDKSSCDAEKDLLLQRCEILEKELSDLRLQLDRDVQMTGLRKPSYEARIDFSEGREEERMLCTSSCSSGKQEETLEEMAISPSQGQEEELGMTPIASENQIQNLEKVNKEYLNEMKKLRTNTQELQFVIKSLENEKRGLKTRLHHLDQSWKTLEADCTKFAENIQKQNEMQIELLEMQLKLADSETRIREQEVEIASYKEALSNLDSGAQSKVDKSRRDSCLRSDSFEMKAVNFKLNESLETLDRYKSSISYLQKELKVRIVELERSMNEKVELYKILSSHTIEEEEEKSECTEESQMDISTSDSLSTSQDTITSSGLFTSSQSRMAEEGKSSDNDYLSKIQGEMKLLHKENEELRVMLLRQQTVLDLQNLQAHSIPVQPLPTPSLEMDDRITLTIGDMQRNLKQLLDISTEPTDKEEVTSKVKMLVMKNLEAFIENVKLKSDSTTILKKLVVEGLQNFIISSLKVRRVRGGEFSSATNDTQVLHIVWSSLKDLDQNLIQLVGELVRTLGIVPAQLFKGQVPSDSGNFDLVVTHAKNIITVREDLCKVYSETILHVQEQIEDVVSRLFDQIKTSVSKLESTGAQAEQICAGTESPLLESQNSLIKDFEEVTTKVYQEAQHEKMQLLEAQKTMVHKILEDNQVKLQQVCEEYTQQLHSSKTVDEAVLCFKALVMALEKTLQAEIVWVEKEYRELVEQYSYEQTLHLQTHTLVVAEMQERMHNILCKNQTQNEEATKIKVRYEAELNQLKEEHLNQIQQLEHQLTCRNQEAHLGSSVSSLDGKRRIGSDEEALDEEMEILKDQIQYETYHRSKVSDYLLSELDNIKIQITQQHLHNLYIDRDWYKKTVGLLSNVTLQLLHYYSVAQQYIQGPSQVSHVSHSLSSPCKSLSTNVGKVLDLSFLSDNGNPEDTEEGLGNETNVEYNSGAFDPSFNLDVEEVSIAGSNLDSTTMSEGMLDDMDKDEQVRQILINSYPQLMAILKGRWDHVNVTNLEREAQELNIAVQAAAGMLKIFIHAHTNSGDENASSSIAVVDSAGDKEATSKSVAKTHLMADSIDGCGSVFSGEQSAIDMAGILEQSDSSETASQKFSSPLSKQKYEERHMPEDFTLLKSEDISSEDKMKEVCNQQVKINEERNRLLIEIHKLQGLVKGYESEKKLIQKESDRQEKYGMRLAMELQAAKDQIVELKGATHKDNGNSADYSSRLEYAREIKDRVRALLSAKDKSMMEREELEQRVGELENILEETVKERDMEVDALKSEVTDLKQQLEVADRQVRSHRQFLDDQAGEREQEREELVRNNEKLTLLIREKESQIAMQANLQKEVDILERDLWEKTQQLEEALASKIEIEGEHKAAVDKIWDLREIIITLEGQLETKVLKENELLDQIQSLTAELAHSSQCSEELSQQLEHLQSDHQMKNQESIDVYDSNESRTIKADEDGVFHSVYSEMAVDVNMQNTSLLQRLEERVERTTRGLEALQISVSSGSIPSDEDLSIKDHLETSSLNEFEEGRVVSPSTATNRLEEKVLSLEKTYEATSKRIRDLEMALKKMRQDYDEITAERDLLQQQSSENLVQISSLQARLEEMRCSDSPHASEIRQRLTRVQTELDKKRIELSQKAREVEELKYTLAEIRGKLVSREEELERIQSTETISLPLTTRENYEAQYRRLEEELASHKDVICTLQDKIALLKAEDSSDSLSPMAHNLIDEKNGEIENYKRKVYNLTKSLRSVQEIIEKDRGTEKAKRIIEASLQQEWKIWTENLNEETPELLRRDNRDINSPLSSLAMAEAKYMISPVPSIISCEGSTQYSQTSRSNLTVESLQQIPAVAQEQLSYPTRKGENYKQHNLEKDHDNGQELLEKRGIELNEYSKMLQDSIAALPSEATEMEKKANTLAVEVAHLQVMCKKFTEENKTLADDVRRLEGEVQAHRENLTMKVKELKETKCSLVQAEKKLQGKTENKPIESEVELRSRIESLNDIVKQKDMEIKEHKHSIAKQDEHLSQLQLHYEELHSEMREKLFSYAKERDTMEQQYQKQISDLQEEHNQREKQLCSNYEERVTLQVSEMSSKFVKEKAEALARLHHQHEAAIASIIREKDHKIKQILKRSEMIKRLKNEKEQGEARDSMGELQSSLQMGLSSTEQPDNVLKGTSVVSEEEEASDHVIKKVQCLIEKIQQEGVQVLSLTEVMFLKMHQSILNDSQLAFVNKTGLLSPEFIPSSTIQSQEASAQDLDSTLIWAVNNKTPLLRHIALLEEELSNKDRQMRKKVAILEFRIQHGKLIGEEWRNSLEAARREIAELHEKLRVERMNVLDLENELTLLRQQLASAKSQCQRIQEERNDALTSLKQNEHKIRSLRESQRAARDNFTRLATTLNHQRQLSTTARNHYNQVVKELRNTIEKERDKIAELMISRDAPQDRTLCFHCSGTVNKKSSIISELEMQLDVERERVNELERAYKHEQTKVAALLEKTNAERLHSRADLQHEEAKTSELMHSLKKVEAEREALERELRDEQEQRDSLETKVRDLQNEMMQSKNQLKAQDIAHQVLIHKARKEAAEAQSRYAQTITKLSNAESEVLTLRQKLSSAQKEVEDSRDIQEQMRGELAAEQAAVQHLGLPALSRIKNMNEFVEYQVRENVELCKSVLHLSNERHSTRLKMIHLESKIENLMEQLNQVKQETNKPEVEAILAAERSTWAAERSALQLAVSRAENKAMKLQSEMRSQPSIPQIIPQTDDARVHYIYGKYQQSESWRKALIWQKQYLMLAISSYQDTEEHTLSRLASMALKSHLPLEEQNRRKCSLDHRHRFRQCVFVVIAVLRMQYLIRRRARYRRFGSQVVLHHIPYLSQPPVSPVLDNYTRCTSSASSLTRLQGATALPLSHRADYSMMGLTPPTKDHSHHSSHCSLYPPCVSSPAQSQVSGSHRNLLTDFEASDLNEYIDRLDNISAQIGYGTTKH